MLTPQILLPISRHAVIAMAILYVLLGLGHDLWKVDDAVNLGVAWDIAHRQHWLRPELAGMAWQGAPFWHWLAAGLGLLLSPFLEFPAAARLASAVCVGILLFAAARCTRALAQSSPPGQHLIFSRATPLLLLGSLGLLIPAHEGQPQLAVLAGHALAYWGLARLPQAARHGAVLLATGLVVTGLSDDPSALLPLIPLLCAVLLLPAWRQRTPVMALIAAVVAAISLLALVAWQGLIPPFAYSATTPGRDHLELLAWFAWPVFPLAVWGLWLNRRQWKQAPVLIPMVGSLASLLVFAFAGNARPQTALPVLLPLALLAATGAGRLRRGAANAFDWFAMMSFTLAAALVWVAAIAMQWGVPARFQYNLLKHTPGFVPEFQPVAWCVAAVLTALWLATIFRTPRSSWRSSVHWCAGVTLMWALITALWMPWIEYRKSYAPVVAKLKQAIPPSACVIGRNLSDAHRAILDVEAQLLVRPAGQRDGKCGWLLTQSSARSPSTPGDEWRKVLEAHRHGEKQERFFLYQRQ